MRNSRINPSCKFNQQRWVVSVLNTGSRWTGHAIILIEGLDSDGSLFVGQYDIKAEPFEDNTNTINIRGYISRVDSFEGSTYTRDYSGYDSNSYDNISHSNAKEIIKAVKSDKEHVDAYNEYRRQIDLGNQPERRIRPLVFQLAGTESTISDKKDGPNCANWCVDKLRDGGINIAKGKKPITVANRSLNTAWRYRYRIFAAGSALVAMGAAAAAYHYFSNDNSNSGPTYN